MADCLMKSNQPKLCLVLYEKLTQIEPDKFIRPIHHQDTPEPRSDFALHGSHALSNFVRFVGFIGCA